MVALNLFALGCASTIQAWTKVKMDGKDIVACRKCQLIQKRAPRCAAPDCALHMHALEDTEENRDLVKELGLDEFCADPKKEDPKYPVDKLLNAFPEELSDYIVPEAGKLTLTYDDSGITLRDETAVDSTTFTHLTDLLMDEAEELAGNGNGIDRSEASALQSLDPKNFEDDKLRAAFKFLDADGSGFIDAEEFGGLCRKLNADVNEDTIAEALDAIDADGDGQLDADEFIKWWRDSHGQLSDGREDLLEDPDEGKDFNKTAKLIEKVDAACTAMSFSTTQAQSILDMADEGPPPVWKYQIPTSPGEDDLYKSYRTQVQKKLELAKTDNLSVCEIEAGVVVDLDLLVQTSAAQWEYDHPPSPLAQQEPTEPGADDTSMADDMADGPPSPLLPPPSVEPPTKVLREAGAGLTPKVELICKMWSKITDTENINALVYGPLNRQFSPIACMPLHIAPLCLTAVLCYV